MSFGNVSTSLPCADVVDELKKRHPAITLIEQPGSGTPLVQDLYGKIQVIPIIPVGEKVVRFQAGTPTIEAGQVHLPLRAPWLDTFKREVLSFPASKNDDQVDAFSQLLNLFAQAVQCSLGFVVRARLRQTRLQGIGGCAVTVAASARTGYQGDRNALGSTQRRQRGKNSPPTEAPVISLHN